MKETIKEKPTGYLTAVDLNTQKEFCMLSQQEIALVSHFIEKEISLAITADRKELVEKLPEEKFLNRKVGEILDDKKLSAEYQRNTGWNEYRKAVISLLTSKINH